MSEGEKDSANLPPGEVLETREEAHDRYRAEALKELEESRPRPAVQASYQSATHALIGAPALSPDSLVCRNCNQVLDKSMKGHKRVNLKSGPVYTCCKCNSKNVILHNQFGQWPIEEFKQFTVEQQQAFYANTENDKWSLKSHLADAMTKKLMEQKTSALSGEFLPLAVWATRGWDPQQIVDGAEKDDVEWHAQAGWTYRVKIHMTDERKIETECREQVMSMMRRYQPKALADRDEAERDETKLHKRDSSRSASSSSAKSTSSCTSSSSGKRSKKQKRKHKKEKKETNKKKEQKHKKDKKERKPKKDKKAKLPSESDSESSTTKEIRKKRAEKEAKKRLRETEKEEAARKREEERAKRKAEAEAEAKKKKETKENESFCAKALARIVPVLSKLELSTSSPNISKIPAHVKGDATSSQKVLTKMQTEAKSKLDGSSATSFSSEDIDAALQKALDAYTALKAQLNSIKK